jgi:hypothetical protein
MMVPKNWFSPRVAQRAALLAEVASEVRSMDSSFSGKSTEITTTQEE